MFRFRLTTDILAPPARVWRALCDAAEVVLWDSGVVQALDTPPDYPRPGQRVRWRLRSGRTLIDEPQVVLPGRALRSLLHLGRLRLDETYTLEDLPHGCRLTLDADVTSAVPLFDRIDGPLARRDFATSLDALKRHCESSP